MSFLKKPFRKLKEKVRDSSTERGSNGAPETASSVSSVNGTGNGTPVNGHTNGEAIVTGNTPDGSRRQSREIITQERQRRSIDKQRTKAETRKRESMARIEDEKFLEEGPEDMTKLYRPFSMNQSKRRPNENRALFKDLDFASMF